MSVLYSSECKRRIDGKWYIGIEMYNRYEDRQKIQSDRTIIRSNNISVRTVQLDETYELVARTILMVPVEDEIRAYELLSTTFE